MENHLTAKYELSDGTKVLTTSHRVMVTTRGFRIERGHYTDSYRGIGFDTGEAGEVLAKAITVYDHAGQPRLSGKWPDTARVAEESQHPYDPFNVKPNKGSI